MDFTQLKLELNPGQDQLLSPGKAKICQGFSCLSNGTTKENPSFNFRMRHRNFGGFRVMLLECLNHDFWADASIEEDSMPRALNGLF